MIPQEIRAVLPGPPTAHAALSCSPGSVVGETHFVVTGGRLLVFSRESLVGGYAPVLLDPAVTPALEGGDFSSTLHFQLADATPVELNVSSFERPAMQALLAELAAIAPVLADPSPGNAPELPNRPDSPTGTSTILPPTEPVAAPVPTTALSADPAGELHPAAASRDTPRWQLPAIPAATAAPGPKKPRDNRGPGEFAGDPPFFTGCLPALLLLAGTGWGLWTLEERVRDSLWGFTGWALWQGTFLMVLGKIAACIGAMALTYWFAVWLEGWNFRRNLTGRVTIRSRRVHFLAPKGLWKSDFDLRKCRVEFQCTQKPPGNNNTKPEDLEFVVLVRFTQGDSQASIWVHSIRWKDIAGSQWQPQTSVEKPERRIEFMGHEFKELLPALLEEKQAAS